MNPKMKRKIIIDVILTAAMLVLMQPAFSGVFAHEWLGVIIGGALVAHLGINRQWITAVGKGFFNRISWEARLNFMINSLMALSMTLTLLSGLLISQYLFAPLAAQNITGWTIIHKFSSWTTLLIVVIHVVLHLDWIKRAVSALLRNPQLQPVRSVIVRTTLGLFAFGAAYSVIQTSAINVLMATQDQTLAKQNATLLNNSTTRTDVSKDSTLDDIDQGTAVVDSLPASSALSGSSSSSTGLSDNAATVDIPTLTQYLSNFTCTACHRHCLLTAPRCNKGDVQVEQYTAQYYSQYPVTAN